MSDSSIGRSATRGRYAAAIGMGVLMPAVATVALTGGPAGSERAAISQAPGAGERLPAIALAAASESQDDPLRDWAQRRAERFAIPASALRAYGYAAAAMAQAQPSCRLGWTTLAGIAHIESDHGRHRGATIASNGLVTPPIRGVALDGTNGNARILQVTASGRTVYAQAAGPFQFIPDTWNRWGVRADADVETVTGLLRSGKPAPSRDLSGSPDNINDAALAAARYLCASGGDLATYRGWSSAIFSYNHSDAYVRQVYSAAGALSS
ncbi:murein transglycosylase [Nocardia salmonicida]|uniref:murein transglycosylase n=1 Tax=Nocardia salmonicida TaxID=53431 RepID=UPI00379D669A